jgi:tRNA A37 threonylcarbamoyladenosine modification protein TsaB
VLAVNAAGRGEAYGALFAADGSEIAPARAASPQIFAAMVTPGVVLAGSGVDLILAALPMDVRPAVAHRNAAPAIAALLALGARAAAPEGPPRPLYLRAPDAKPQAGAAIARR